MSNLLKGAFGRDIKMRHVLIHCFFFLSGNFVFQWFQETPDFAVAVERTWFQLVTVLFIWWLLRKRVAF